MRHNRISLCVHLVWRTWDRLPLIVPEVAHRLQRAIEAEGRQMGCTVLAVNGTEDHVHVLVLMPAGLAVAALVKQMKGVSSRIASQSLLPGQFRWQGHYGAFSISRWDMGKVRRYIEEQKEHHADGSLVPELEEATEEVVSVGDRGTSPE